MYASHFVTVLVSFKIALKGFRDNWAKMSVGCDLQIFIYCITTPPQTNSGLVSNPMSLKP